MRFQNFHIMNHFFRSMIFITSKDFDFLLNFLNIFLVTDPVVDTKRKPLFKNFRLRLKLSNNKIEKPENVAEKIQEKTRLQKFANFFKFRGLRKRRTKKSHPPKKKALEESTTSDGNCNRLSTNVDENVAVVGFDENDFDRSHQPQAQEDEDDEDEEQDQGKSLKLEK